MKGLARDIKNLTPRFVACAKCRAIDQTLVKVDDHYECQDKAGCQAREVHLKLLLERKTHEQVASKPSERKPKRKRKASKVPVRKTARRKS